MDSGVFGTGLSFVQLVVTLLILIGGTIAVKVSLNFDLNKYLESRQEKLKAKCRNACLHFEFFNSTDGVAVRSFFVSPSGTLNHICQRCGLVRLHLDQEQIQQSIDYYAQNIEQYKKQNKKFHRLLKKAGMV